MIDSEITNTVEVEEKEEKISVVDSLFQKLQTQFNDSQSIMKTLQSNVKIFYKEVLKERKELEKKIAKNKKKNKRKKSMSGLAFPSHISEENYHPKLKDKNCSLDVFRKNCAVCVFISLYIIWQSYQFNLRKLIC